MVLTQFGSFGTRDLLAHHTEDSRPYFFLGLEKDAILLFGSSSIFRNAVLSLRTIEIYIPKGLYFSRSKMSHDIPMNEQEPQKVTPSPALVKEAGYWLSKVSQEYFWTIGEIEKAEVHLEAMRSKKTQMLRENPWLGNIQGIVQKEATKIATEASIPPEELNQEIQSLAQEEKHLDEEVAEDPEARKKKEDKLQDIQAKKTRRSLLKKIQLGAAKSRKSQFPPGHPSHGKH